MYPVEYDIDVTAMLIFASAVQSVVQVPTVSEQNMRVLLYVRDTVCICHMYDMHHVQMYVCYVRI
jgi:hypothetical protein